MALITIPKQENITGANLTGTEPDANRTYALVNKNSIVTGMQIVIANTILQYSIDFTFSAGVVTFLNPVWDNQAITINYLTTATNGTLAISAYASTAQLNKYMHSDAYIPDLTIVGGSRSLEEVGTGDGTTTRFYVDHASIIAGTYSFYYGSDETEALTQELTETTHYTLDKKYGVLTLTTAGVTLVSTDKIYAEYEYNKLNISDAELQNALDRAASEINDDTLNHWADGTEDTPNYIQVTDEKHTGKGKHDKDYFLQKFPLPDVSTQLSVAVTVGDTTLNVDSTAGFPSTGTLSIGTEKFTYSAKTSNTFTIPAATAAHSIDDDVYPWVFEASVTGSGTEPTWVVLEANVDYDLDLQSGRVHIYKNDIELSTFANSNPPRLVPNRFKATYIWGNESTPKDIERLNLMLAARDMLHGAVRKAYTQGMNDFNPSMIEVDKEWIEKTLEKYRNFQTDNI